MSAEIQVIDLNFQNTKESIGSFLIKTSKGPVLIESGPESTFEQLEKGINNAGYQVADIYAVLLTHIHFDHAGAAWKFANNGSRRKRIAMGSGVRVQDVNRLLKQFSEMRKMMKKMKK